MKNKRKLPVPGDVFGALTVIAVPNDTRIFHGKWLCRCKCGSTTEVKAGALLSGQKACGCGTGRKALRVPQVGDKFGNWTVVSNPDMPMAVVRIGARWNCQCACGTMRWVVGKNLISGGSTGCGCGQQKLIEERRNQHSAKVSWRKLLHAVSRGEAVLDESWRDFANFFAFLGERPQGSVLSRQDLEGVYGPDNCFWEERPAQIRRLLEYRRSAKEPLAAKDGTTKRCSKCKAEKSLDDFYVNNTAKDKRQSSCKSCSAQLIREIDLADPIKAMLGRARTRAREKGFEFTLETEHLRPLPTHCPVFGIALTRGNGHQDPSAYSLDRIDNMRGYVPGNVVVMSYLANRLKNNGTAAQHAQIAQWMRNREDFPTLSSTAGLSTGLLL
jgi:hypothetical protein